MGNTYTEHIKVILEHGYSAARMQGSVDVFFTSQFKLYLIIEQMKGDKSMKDMKGLMAYTQVNKTVAMNTSENC